MLVQCLLIKGDQSELCTYGIFNALFWNGRRVFAETLPVLDSIGAAPDHLARGSSDAAIVAPTFPTN